MMYLLTDIILLFLLLFRLKTHELSLLRLDLGGFI